MKTDLQKYSAQTHRLLAASIFVTLAGAFIYFAWSSLGAVLAAIGLIGLAWSWLRR
jgi:hypothetical protein